MPRDQMAHARGLFLLGACIVFGFFLSCGATLVGLFFLFTSEVKLSQDVALAVGALVGTIIGYVSAAAQAVINFFFGSSLGSKVKSTELVSKSGGG